MRAGLGVAAAVGAALLFAALAGVEWSAERQLSTEQPVFTIETPDPLPSVSEVEEAEGLASPALTR